MLPLPMIQSEVSGDHTPRPRSQVKPHPKTYPGLAAKRAFGLRLKTLLVLPQFDIDILKVVYCFNTVLQS